MAARGREPGDAERRLYGEALAAAGNAHAPYSGLRVGAAVAGPSGRAHLGVNVENASYPAGMCAERVALGAMVTAGERTARAVAVATADDGEILPCGMCLQALAEFGDPDIVCRCGERVRVFSLHDLLPAPFSAREAQAEGPS